MRVLPIVLNVVARLSSRVFVGLPLCQCSVACITMVHYSHDRS